MNLEKFAKVFFFLSALGVLLWFLLLAGCEPENSYGPPLLTECDYSTPRSIVVAEYENEADLERAYKELNKDFKPRDFRSYGFATHHIIRDPLTREIVREFDTLHILKIRGQDDHDRIETLGHEALHSFCGAWHPVVAGTS